MNSVYAGCCPASKKMLVDGAPEKSQKIKGVIVARATDTWSQRMYSALLFCVQFLYKSFSSILKDPHCELKHRYA